MYSSFLYLFSCVNFIHNLKFFHLLFNIPLYDITTLYLSILLMMNIRLVSSFGLVLLWIFFYGYICHSTVFNFLKINILCRGVQ